MKYYLSLFISLLMLNSSIAQVKNNRVVAITSMPPTILAGDSFDINITIVKPNLRHYGEFQQKLPKGFTAYEKRSDRADFKFTKQTVSFTWLRLPTEERFSVTYSVKVDTGIIGNFRLQGQFLYVYNNQRGAVVVDPLPIVVTKKIKFNFNHQNATQTSTNTNTQNTTQANTQNTAVNDPNKVQVIRKRSSTQPEIIKLKVNLGEIQGGTSIKEIIPVGYRVEKLQTNGAIFTFNRQNAEFLWSSLPASRNFEISYKLIPLSGTGNKPPLKGEILYIKSGKVIHVPIVDETAKSNGAINSNDVINFITN